LERIDLSVLLQLAHKSDFLGPPRAAFILVALANAKPNPKFPPIERVKTFLSPRVEHSYYVDLSVELQSYAHFGEEPGRRGQATPLRKMRLDGAEASPGAITSCSLISF